METTQAVEARDLTVEQAISVLPEGEDIHTFMNPGGMLIGSDWKRSTVEASIRAFSGANLTGDLARRMGHGIAIIKEGRWVFILSDEKALAAVEASTGATP